MLLQWRRETGNGARAPRGPRTRIWALAVAFFALALGFHLLHAAEPEVQVARLNTAELYRALDIEAHQAYADLMRFAHNLRLAYELRAYLAEREAEATSKPAPEVKGKGNSAGKPLACPLATAKPGF